MRRKARESKVERILRLIAWRKSGEMVFFFVKRARRFRNAGVLKTPESTRAPKMGESRITTRAFYKKNTIFPDFGDGKCLRILSTFDSRCF